jgi:hypothetical protein
MIPLSMRQIALAAAGAAALLAFAAGWWGNDDGGRRKFAAPAVPEWVLPKPIVTDVSGFTKILAQRVPFGSPAEQAKPAPAGPQPASPRNAGAAQWRVGGIVTSGTSRYLVVLIRRPGENTTRTEVRNPGEELPDGSIVRTVDPADVTIDRQGTIIRIKMFAQN